MAVTALRMPRPPAVVPAGVIVGARPAQDHEIPSGALRVADAAAGAGWEVAVTYARARGSRGRREKLAFDEENPRAPKTRLVTEPAEIPTVAVRMLRVVDGSVRAYRVALWSDGAFAFCWHLDRRRWHRIGAPRLMKVLKREQLFAKGYGHVQRG